MFQKTTLAENFNPEKIRTRTIIGALTAGLVSLVFIVGAFWVGIKIFPRTSLLPDTFGFDENTRQVNWSELDGMAGLATVALVIGGILFAFVNYVQTAVQRKREDAEASFSIYRELYDRLMNEKALEARRWIILNIPTLEQCGNDQEKWRERVKTLINSIPPGWQGERAPGTEYLKNVLNTFDFIGFVARHYWNMDNELVRWMSPSVAKVWERIEAYVEEEAKLRNEDDYYESAREFGKHCVAWRNEKGWKSVIIENAT